MIPGLRFPVRSALPARSAAWLLALGVLAGAAPAVADVEQPLLDRLIATSLLASPTLTARRSEVSAARSDIDAARWQYTPQVSADLQQGSGGNAYNNRVLRVDQRLYAGGRLDADLHTAASRRDSAVHAVRENALLIATQIATAYQTLAAANSQLLAIDAYRQRLDALDDRISRRIESGVSANADRSLMSARRAQSTNDLASVRATQRSALATLEKLVGAPEVVRAVAPQVGVVAILPVAPSTICADSGAADAQLRNALSVHPGLQRMERDIETARSQVDSQRAALKPTVGLRFEQPIAPGADATLRSTRVSIVMQYAPDAGLSTLARTQGSSERVASLVYQADAMAREVTQQIRAECAEQAGVIERVDGYAVARGYTSEVLASSTRLFVAGKRSWLDLLNAAREDFDNEQGGIVAGAALIGSSYRLALLTGERRLALPGVADEPASDLGNTVKALFR